MSCTSSSGSSKDKSHIDSPTFSQLWEKRLSTNSAESVFGLAQAADGGFVCLAQTDADISGNKTEVSRGGTDFWLIKVDEDGNYVWDKTYGGDQEDYAREIIATSDGGFLVVGFSYSSNTGDRTDVALGSEDIWVVKVKADGSKEWDRAYGGSAGDHVESVLQTADGGYLIIGTTFSPIGGDVSIATKGVGDVWILKIESDGTYEWDGRYGGNNNDWGRDATELSDGDFLIIGDTNSDASGDISEDPIGSRDYWLIRVDYTGGLVWEERFGGDDTDTATCIIQTNDGNCIIGGRSDSGIHADKTTASRGSVDQWIIKVDLSGAKIWDKAFGGDFIDYLNDMYNGLDNTVMLLGHSYNDGAPNGDISDVTRGMDDYWILRIDERDGSKLWDKRWGGNNSDESHGLCALGDGTYVVAGKCASTPSGDVGVSGFAGTYDVWLMKFDDGPWSPGAATVNAPVIVAPASNN